MSKRTRVDSADLEHSITSSISTTKRARRTDATLTFKPIKTASQAAAAAVDADPPFAQLLAAQTSTVANPTLGDCVVYWMRMSDLRITDNRALSRASERAQQKGIPLVVVFIFSPQDYIAHDRSARRIDFMLRNLQSLKRSFEILNIPFYTTTMHKRTAIPSKMVSLLVFLGCMNLFANIEHEVDELRRDIKICDLAKLEGIQVNFIHDKCVVEPGIVLTKQQKAYTVYSPYQRSWLATLNDNIPYYLEDCPLPKANPESIRASEKLCSLFHTSVPESLSGFELSNTDRETMTITWPAGEIVANEILVRFLRTKARPSQLGIADPLAPGAVDSRTESRISCYHKARDRVDLDSTSRMSAYLAAGVLSARQCVRATMLILHVNKVDGSSTSGIGRWIQEIAWRDFYTNIIAYFPRTSMGRPFLEKFSTVLWENHQSPGKLNEVKDITDANATADSDGETLRRWKAGQTGVPIVDAAMRCINKMGWVHNRARMISAMYLTKDLMIDWRVGERYFMEMLVDGDLASNNGGWQWCASTGVDPCPYFRIFNPYTQSEKTDPTGEFIKEWVPELQHLKIPELYHPSTVTAKKQGYPMPIVDHKLARERALRRYKNPGQA
ncbi:DNA photolyase, FAD-binding/Cryptochrome [Crucibulum laeve]|uniref:DNA photolyase, FAD-binding/Cryptochrome n=1 Tax=Crucibulum laeve TaxID=68775 RepID=A0A5C3MDF0_9AGAR|nr:DNA photolyase, FAD-binding/Cryptochrome [Crucibulum laeve]